MITMHQFLGRHGITGNVILADSNPLDAPVPGARHYRAILRHPDGRSFETRCSRADAEEPAIADVMAEVARRASVLEEPATETRDTVITAERASEANRLQDFLGAEAYRELLFEFGHREPDRLDEADPIGTPARPEEMTNQEPAELRRAAEHVAVPRKRPFVLSVIAPLSVVAGIGLVIRGRSKAGALVITTGIASALAGMGLRRWSGRKEAQAQEDELRKLSEEHTAIQAR